MYEKAHKILITGMDDDTLADLYENIGKTYLSLSDTNKAIENIKKSLDGRLMLFGYNHKKTIQSLHSLGYAYETVDFQTSIHYYHQALDLQVETYGINTYMARTICDSLMWCYNNLNNYESSLIYAKHAYEITLFLNDKEPYYAHQVGECYFSLERFLDAVPYYEEALKDYPQESEEFFDCMCSLANAQRMGKDFDSAGMTYKDILHSARRRADPHLLARAYRIYAYFYLDMGDDSQALTFLDQSYNSCPDDVSSAEVRRLSSVLLRRLGQYDRALSYCCEAYDLFKKNNDEKKLSHCQITQGLTYKEMGCFQQARECFTKAWEIRRTILPQGDPLIQECLDYLNSLKQSLWEGDSF